MNLASISEAQQCVWFRVFWCFILFMNPTRHCLAVVDIDNGLIGDPTVTCGANSVSIDFQTNNSFMGRVFVKGYSQNLNCQLLGMSERRVFGFSINFGQCGLSRNREITGISITTTVVISFHPIFITKLDRAYRLNCFYTEKRQSVSQELSINTLTTQVISKQLETPVCRYDILSDGPDGGSIKYAKIGDLVYHKWSCETMSPNLYCMRVHSCAVNDGQGGEPFYVLDSNGCELDSYVLKGLYYTSDLSAGQFAYVFKFADRPTMNFNCQIELTLRDSSGCEKMQPQCSRDIDNYGNPSSAEDKDPYYNASTPTTKPDANNGYPTQFPIDLNADKEYNKNAQVTPSQYSLSKANVYTNTNSIPNKNYGSVSTVGYGNINTQKPVVPSINNNLPNLGTEGYGIINSAKIGYGNVNLTTSSYGNGNTQKPVVPNNNYNSNNANEKQFRQYRLNFAKYELTNATTELPLSDSYNNQPDSAKQPIAPFNQAYQQYKQIPANIYATNDKAPSKNFFLTPHQSQTQVRPSFKTDESETLSSKLLAEFNKFYAENRKAVTPQPTSIKPATTSSYQSVFNSGKDENLNFNFPSPLDIDPLYQDEVEAFVHHSTEIMELNKPFAAEKITKKTKRNIPHRKIVLDFSLPEQSLVVVDIDENSLAQKLLDAETTKHLMRGAKTFVPLASTTNNSNKNCVSYEFFVAFSFVSAVVSALFAAFLALSLRYSTEDTANGHKTLVLKMFPIFSTKFLGRNENSAKQNFTMN